MWLPCRHLAPGKSRHHTSLYGVTDRVTADGKVPVMRFQGACGGKSSGLVQTGADPIGTSAKCGMVLQGVEPEGAEGTVNVEDC